jgi:transcriptional regulator of met regulon
MHRFALVLDVPLTSKFILTELQLKRQLNTTKHASSCMLIAVCAGSIGQF